MVLITARTSPFDFSNVLAMRATSAWRRIVGDKMPRQLQRNMLGGVLIFHQQIEDLFSILDAAALDLLSHHTLGVGIMNPLIKVKLRIFRAAIRWSIR